MSCQRNLFFVTVNYFSSQLIKELIVSIQSNINCDPQLVIVNNSPTDTELIKLSKENQSIKIIEAKDNLGFAKACNIAINYIYSSDSQALIWLINPDATLDSDAISNVLQCLKKDESIAILGTKIRDSQGNIWFSHGSLNRYLGWAKHEKRDCQKTQEIPIKTMTTKWVCGCSLIINLSQFDHCPQFDDNYFLYGEDLDFCEKYNHLNYHIAITNQALVTHKVSKIIGKNFFNLYKNYTFSRLYFINKNASQLALYIYIVYTLFKVVTTFIKKPLNAKGRLAGINKFLNIFHLKK